MDFALGFTVGVCLCLGTALLISGWFVWEALQDEPYREE